MNRLITVGSRYQWLASIALCLVMHAERSACAQAPAPVLESVFPCGGQLGHTVDVTVTGNNLQGIRALRCNAPGVRCEPLEQNRFRLSIPADTIPGLYDLWVACERGISAPRTFLISNRAERLETEPNNSLSEVVPVPLDVVVNGCIDKLGDLDHICFEAKRGQRVVIECWSERIDSRLRAVLELFDAEGRRLAVNRGYFGTDPFIDFRAPADGSYVVRVHDLIWTGSADHYYRLDIDTGPRVAFTVPTVVERGKSSRITLYGWNLADPSDGQTPHAVLSGVASDDTRSEPAAPGAFDRTEVEIPASLAEAAWPLPVRSAPAGAVFEGFAYHFPGSHAAVAVGVSDIPVVLDRSDNHTPASAQLITYPCEVSGQLGGEEEQDWYAIEARRGEVLHIEGLAQRLDSPVDLDISVLDASGEHVLATFGDESRNTGGSAFPTNHLDPVGRWVVPADGRFLIAVRNLSGRMPPDPRRTYRLSVRREDPDFQLVAVPHSHGPASLNVRRGGRELLDVLAFRRRGHHEPIRIAARDLPEGVECPDVWLGSGVDRATVVVSAAPNASNVVGELKLEGSTEAAAFGLVGDSPSDLTSRRQVRGGTVVRSGMPNGWGRITSQIPLAVSDDTDLRITADGHEMLDHHLYGKLRVRHAPGGILDVAVRVERRDTEHQAPVKLIGVGLPELIRNQTATIPAGQLKGYLSFYLPPTLPTGRYSLVVGAETTVPAEDKKNTTVTVYSNPITFEVEPAAFLVEVDPFAPTRARRGEVLQIRYSAQRRNGFIGKMHTELAAPGLVTDVVGLRGRGETFVGQTDTGSLQIIVNDDAPLGRQPFLRLFTVGVVEDQPVFFGSSFLALEIVE